jgi:hypothetical protein
VFIFGFRNGRFWFPIKIKYMSYHSIFEITHQNLEETLPVIHVVPIMVCNALLAHSARFVHPITSPTILPCNEAVRGAVNLGKYEKNNPNDRQASVLQIWYDSHVCRTPDIFRV